MSKVNSEFRRIEIDQLHNATMEFNKNSLELKKIYIGLYPAVVTLAYFFAPGTQHYSWWRTLFILTLVLTIGVWLLDSYYHYYQRKLRNVMIRHKNAFFDKKTNLLSNSKRKSLFNLSHLIYVYFVFVSFAAFLITKGAS